MSIASKFCKQDAVYFAPGAKDKFGSTAFSDPVAVRVRWEDKKTEVLLEGAIRVTASHHILINQDVEEGGLLWLGTLEDWEALNIAAVQASLPDHHRIVSFNKIPNMRATDYLREVYC